MKKILLLITIALLSYSSSFAIGGFKVVVKKPGAAIDVQVRIVDYAPTAPTTEFTGATVNLTPNASGIIVASVPETPGILATDVTSNYLVEVWTGSPLVLTSQQRLDDMIFDQAQSGLTDNEGNVTLEPGKELIFPEPTGSGTNFTSFKSPALAADVEYTLPIDDGNANQYLKTDGSGIMSWDTPPTSPTGSAGGSLAGTYPNPTIAASAITNTEVSGAAAIAYSKLALNNSIVNGDLTANSVTTSKVADGTITTAKISDGQVTTTKIADGAITEAKIASSAVATAKIANSAVTTGKINDGAVTEAKLADDAVTTAKITDKNVTPAKIANGTASGQVLTYNGTDAVWAAPAGGGGGGCNIYGDGSAGDVVINANTDWSTTPPTNGNFMFNSLTISGGVTLTVPSGTVIQCKTTFSNSGTITVKHGTLGRAWAGNADGGNTDVLGNTMASRKAYPNSETYRRLTNLGIKGGSAGGTGGHVSTTTFGGNGGGTFTVLASTSITNGGTINASGQTSPTPTERPGSGGGGGGFVLLASNGNITNSGTVNSSGGNGGNAGSGGLDYGGGGGGGGLIHYISPNADAVAGTSNVSGGSAGTSDGTDSSGGDGGASVGDGGIGDDAPAAGSAGAVLRTKVADACSFINR